MKTKLFMVVALLITLLSCRKNVQDKLSLQDEKKKFFNVAFSHGDNGKLKATNADSTPFSTGKAEENAIITFTATP